MNESFEQKIAPRIGVIAGKDAAHAIFVRQAVRDGHWRVMCQAGDMVAAEKAALAVLERFESNLETHLSKKADDRAAQQENDRIVARDLARKRALEEARRNSMTISQILGEGEKLGVPIELRDGELCARGALPIELQAQIQIKYDAIIDHLKDAWAPIARW